MLKQKYDVARSTVIVGSTVQRERKLMQAGLVVSLSSYLVFQLVGYIIGIF